MTACRNDGSSAYYESVADEFQSVAEDLLAKSDGGEEFGRILKQLAEQIREGASWMSDFRDGPELGLLEID